MGENKKSNFDKELSQAIDRMLAGEKTEPYADMPDDYREAIDFAQKLIDLKRAPRPSFKAELKDSLLSKLSEMEEERAGRIRFWERLKHLIPQRPLWRAVAASLAVVIVAGGVILGTGILSKPPIPAPTTPYEEPPPIIGPAGLIPLALQLEITPAKADHLTGEDIKLGFKFKNIVSEPVIITPFPPTIGVAPLRMDDRKDWKEQVIRSFPAGPGELSLQPGETAKYTLIWDQKDDNEQQVIPGWYGIWGEVKTRVADEGIYTQCRSGRFGEVLIQYPQGAMEKDIELNQSQTVNGITITLERVELSPEGAMFYAFTTPPGYSLSQGRALPPPQWVIHAWAQYTVDGITKNAGPCDISFQDNGMRLSWGNGGGWDIDKDWLDPVPSDAEELTFTITKFGDWQGTWEFHIVKP